MMAAVRLPGRKLQTNGQFDRPTAGRRNHHQALHGILMRVIPALNRLSRM
jgi:hypothetical protein